MLDYDWLPDLFINLLTLTSKFGNCGKLISSYPKLSHMVAFTLICHRKKFVPKNSKDKITTSVFTAEVISQYCDKNQGKSRANDLCFYLLACARISEI